MGKRCASKKGAYYVASLPETRSALGLDCVVQPCGEGRGDQGVRESGASEGDVLSGRLDMRLLDG